MLIKQEELTVVLDKHRLWLDDQEVGERANLTGANLTGANLTDANLTDANLTGAILTGANGNMREIKSLFLETWPITYTSEYLQIGCERHLITEWWDFDDDRIHEMDSMAMEFWTKWKLFIQQAIEMSPATPTGHEDKPADKTS